MERISFLTIAMGLAASCVLAQDPGATPGWDRYSIILSRAPFGVAPATPVAPAMPQLTPQELNFAEKMRVAFIRRKSDGSLRVGIVDDANPKWQTILEVGRTSQDGITLVSADYENSKALVQKGSVSQEIFSSGSGGARPPAAAPSRSVITRGQTATAQNRYVDRVKRRREEQERSVREKLNTPPKLQGDELNQHLQNYQMDLIRAGGEMGPALPMQLTQEMDDQLVTEGVLPPAE